MIPNTVTRPSAGKRKKRVSFVSGDRTVIRVPVSELLRPDSLLEGYRNGARVDVGSCRSRVALSVTNFIGEN